MYYENGKIIIIGNIKKNSKVFRRKSEDLNKSEKKNLRITRRPSAEDRRPEKVKKKPKKPKEDLKK